MMRVVGWMVAAVVALAGAGCAQERPAVAVGDEPDIVGVVTRVQPAELTVEAEPADEAGSPKASVRIEPRTTVREANGRVVDVTVLAVGHTVRVWFDGPAAESYPLQAVAREIVLEPEPVASGGRP